MYWVYEDEITKSARIHLASCSYCNDGMGKKGVRLPDNRWHGPFETERDAIDKAQSTGQPNAKGCWYCLRNLGTLC